VRSRILAGETGHARLHPVEHRFRYPLFYFVFDIRELEAVECRPLFARNRAAIFSLRERDYLASEVGSLETKLRSLLSANGFQWGDEAAYLVTMPRVLGYIFNPVSFYLVFDAAQHLCAMVCEVNNTFGEKHLYTHIPQAPAALPYTFPLTKEFFVSPFFDTTGRYEVAVRSFEERFDVGITLIKEQPVFWAGLSGEWRPFSRGSLLRLLATFPLTAFLTMTRIHLHAVRLRVKKLVPWMKPKPVSPRTVRSNQNLIHRLRLGIIAFWRRRSGAVD